MTTIAEPLAAALQDISAALREIATSGYTAEMDAGIEMLVEAFRGGRKLLIFGNGGSAADAQHISAEFLGRFLKRRAALPAIALSSNEAAMTAWANDYSYAEVFSRQVEAFGCPGDVAWGISTSGNSENVVAGLRTACCRGLRTIGLTGALGGEMRPFCDVLLAVPLTSTPRIQEAHLVTYHLICEAVERRLFP